MAQVMNRDNLYAAPNHPLQDERLPRRHWAVEVVCPAIRAVLDLAILLLMLLALSTAFDLLQGEAGASWFAPLGFGAALVVVFLVRHALVTQAEARTPKRHWPLWR